MPESADGQLEDRPLRMARRTLRLDAAAVAAVEEQLGSALEEAGHAVLTCSGKVLVTGLGTSGATARRLAHLLSVGGTPALFVHAADGLHGGLGAVDAGDVLIAISKGGESGELNDFVLRARQRGARAIALTAEGTSSLATVSDVVVIVRTPEEVDPGGLIAMGSSLAMSATGDALVAWLMESRGHSWITFGHAHPGGAVGRRLEEADAGSGSDGALP